MAHARSRVRGRPRSPSRNHRSAEVEAAAGWPVTQPVVAAIRPLPFPVRRCVATVNASAPGSDSLSIAPGNISPPKALVAGLQGTGGMAPVSVVHVCERTRERSFHWLSCFTERVPGRRDGMSESKGKMEITGSVCERPGTALPLGTETPHRRGLMAAISSSGEPRRPTHGDEGALIATIDLQAFRVNARSPAVSGREVRSPGPPHPYGSLTRLHTQR